MGVFVISQGGKRLLCMADEVAEEVVSVEVHVDGMTIRGAARREAAEEARRMAENAENVEDKYDAIWDVIAAHGAKLNVMQNELMELLPPKRRLAASGITTTVYYKKQKGTGRRLWYFDKPAGSQAMSQPISVLNAKGGTCTCTETVPVSVAKGVECKGTCTCTGGCTKTTKTHPQWDVTGEPQDWAVNPDTESGSYLIHLKQLYTATCPACTGTCTCTGII